MLRSVAATLVMSEDTVVILRMSDGETERDQNLSVIDVLNPL